MPRGRADPLQRDTEREQEDVPENQEHGGRRGVTRSQYEISCYQGNHRRHEQDHISAAEEKSPRGQRGPGIGHKR